MGGGEAGAVGSLGAADDGKRLLAPLVIAMYRRQPKGGGFGRGAGGHQGEVGRGGANFHIPGVKQLFPRDAFRNSLFYLWKQ